MIKVDNLFTGIGLDIYQKIETYKIVIIPVNMTEKQAVKFKNEVEELARTFIDKEKRLKNEN